MAKVFNGTAHPIRIYHENAVDQTNPRKLILRPGATPVVFELPPGENLNCEKGNLPAPDLDVPFPVKGAITFLGVDPLPEGYDLYVVSNLYRAAYRQLHGDSPNLATVDGVVYDSADSIRPCGCTGLAVG